MFGKSLRITDDAFIPPVINDDFSKDVLSPVPSPTSTSHYLSPQIKSGIHQDEYSSIKTVVASDNEVTNGFVTNGKLLPYVFEANESGVRKRSSKILPVCGVCGKKFVCVTTMKRHLVTHTGEKPFSCKVCGKQYTQKGNLRVHERTHRNDRPFECNICLQKFYRKEPMQKHQWRQHGIVHCKQRPPYPSLDQEVGNDQDQELFETISAVDIKHIYKKVETFDDTKAVGEKSIEIKRENIDAVINLSSNSNIESNEMDNEMMNVSKPLDKSYVYNEGPFYVTPKILNMEVSKSSTDEKVGKINNNVLEKSPIKLKLKLAQAYQKQLEHEKIEAASSFIHDTFSSENGVINLSTRLSDQDGGVVNHVTYKSSVQSPMRYNSLNNKSVPLVNHSQAPVSLTNFEAIDLVQSHGTREFPRSLTLTENNLESNIDSCNLQAYSCYRCGYVFEQRVQLLNHLCYPSSPYTVSENKSYNMLRNDCTTTNNKMFEKVSCDTYEYEEEFSRSSQNFISLQPLDLSLKDNQDDQRYTHILSPNTFTTNKEQSGLQQQYGKVTIDPNARIHQFNVPSDYITKDGGIHNVILRGHFSQASQNQTKVRTV